MPPPIVDASLNAIMTTLTTTFQSIFPNGSENSFTSLLNSFTTTDAYKRSRDAYLLQELNTKKQKLTDLPEEIGRAEKNYYEYNKGIGGGDVKYRNVIFDRYATTAREFKTNSIEKQQEFATNLSQALKQYQGQLVFLKQTDNLLATRMQEQKDLIKKINKYEAILQTSQRKVIYENTNTDSLFLYRRIMLYIYYTAVIGYILFGNFIPDELYKKYTVWLILFIAIIMPLILNLTIKWFVVMYDAVSYWFTELPTKDVYADL